MYCDVTCQRVCAKYIAYWHILHVETTFILRHYQEWACKQIVSTSVKALVGNFYKKKALNDHLLQELPIHQRQTLSNVNPPSPHSITVAGCGPGCVLCRTEGAWLLQGRCGHLPRPTPALVSWPWHCSRAGNGDFTITEKAPTMAFSPVWKCLLALLHLRIY